MLWGECPGTPSSGAVWCVGEPRQWEHDSHTLAHGSLLWAGICMGPFLPFPLSLLPHPPLLFLLLPPPPSSPSSRFFLPFPLSPSSLSSSLCCPSSQLPVVIFLMRMGADWKAVDKDGDTVLHFACMKEVSHGMHDKTLEFLMTSSFATLKNTQNIRGDTPIMVATRYRGGVWG